MYEISADESKWLNYESNFAFTHIFIVTKPFDVLFETNKDLHCSFIFSHAPQQDAAGVQTEVQS